MSSICQVLLSIFSPFNNHFLSTYWVPGPMLCSGNTDPNKTLYELNSIQMCSTSLSPLEECDHQKEKMPCGLWESGGPWEGPPVHSRKHRCFGLESAWQCSISQNICNRILPITGQKGFAQQFTGGNKRSASLVENEGLQKEHLHSNKEYANFNRISPRLLKQLQELPMQILLFLLSQ